MPICSFLDAGFWGAKSRGPQACQALAQSSVSLHLLPLLLNTLPDGTWEGHGSWVEVVGVNPSAREGGRVLHFDLQAAEGDCLLHWV